MTPTKAGGTDLERALTVLIDSSFKLFYPFFSWVDPYVIIFGFNRHPSNKILFFCKALKTAVNTFSVILWQCSAEWDPSDKIYGSTIGTSPFSWQIAAYRASPQAFYWIDCSEGSPSPIWRTALHLANLQPNW